jgi:hypothetical protein
MGLRNLIEQRTLSPEEFHLQCCTVVLPGGFLALTGAITATIEVRTSAVPRAFS